MDPRKSPFPGMDPYLEAKWPEVHATLIVYARNQLNPQLPDDLQTNIEPTLAVCVDDDFSHAVRHLEIVDASGRVITVIELLSPWNKTEQRAQERYRRKQADYLAAGRNLVEIDLVRQGEYVPGVPELEVPKVIRTTCMICVYRGVQPNRIEVYPAPLRERLPNIPVPLRPGEQNAVLQLQPLVDDCYRDGRYYRTNYQHDPQPPLSPDDARWLDALLRKQGLRA
jgi:hypothetical protein